jgi:phosphomannomutase
MKKLPIKLVVPMGKFINPKIVIGCDIRLTSESLKQATIQGLNDAGVDVLDLGMTGTEEVYFGFISMFKAVLRLRRAITPWITMG